MLPEEFKMRGCCGEDREVTSCKLQTTGYRLQAKDRWGIFFVAAAVIFSAGCQERVEQKIQAPETIPVRAMKVGLMDLDDTLDYVGNIKAQDEVMVYPKVSGKISEKIKEEGQVVEKGETLAFIDRDEVGLKFEKAPVDSPLSGVIAKVYVDIGSNVSAQTPVAMVVNMDTVKINLDIPEQHLPKVSLGQEATVAVDAYPQERLLAKVTKVSPMVNLENRAAPVEITLDNPEHRLKSGMFAKVALKLKSRAQVPVILKEAIIGKIPDAYVFTVENGKAAVRKVSLGIRNGPLYEVTQGVRAGDMVVVMGQQRLSEGAAVTMETGNGNATGDAQ
jgi:multidrug efflux pump subunit AcrA (membrane-fusion protein)